MNGLIALLYVGQNCYSAKIRKEGWALAHHQRKMTKTNHMQYQEGMEIISSDIMDKIQAEMKAYDYKKYNSEDVLAALSHQNCSIEDFKALLSPVAELFIEQIAHKAKEKTRKHFGNSVYLFTPLYTSNYCENHCIYCGFNCKNKILRAKLAYDEIEKEMQAIAQSGLEEILILTGESRKMSGVDYIGETCKIAKKYFKVIGLEVYPMNTDEYKYLQECGADYITVFQETYDSDKYETLHLAGAKRVYPYRINSQERALMGGMRGVGFAALLGLADFRKDTFATGLHAYLIQKKYPHAEIFFSIPRLRPIINNDMQSRSGIPARQPKAKNALNISSNVKETQLLQVMCAYRIFMPFAGMTISTRERKEFRDNVIGIAATKISAGVSTGVGSHAEDSVDKGDNQFEIADARDVDEIYSVIKSKGLQPVMNDYIYV